jgi:hypothetical protein
VSVTARGNQRAGALQAMHDGNGVLLHLLDHDRGGFQALARRWGGCYIMPEFARVYYLGRVNEILRLNRLFER